MRWISIITGLLTLTVALFSFVVSFVSLRDISNENGFPVPIFFPLTIEAGVIIFSLNALYRYLNQEKTTWQWFLVIFSSGLALTFNILHANNNLISQVMFAVPSLFFLLSFENFLSQIRHIVKRNLIQNSLRNLLEEITKKENEFQNQLTNHQNQLNMILSNVEKSKTELQSIKIELKETKKQLELAKNELQNNSNPVEKRRQQIEILYKEGLDKNKIAEQLGVSLGTIYNDIKLLGLNGK